MSPKAFSRTSVLIGQIKGALGSDLTCHSNSPVFRSLIHAESHRRRVAISALLCLQRSHIINVTGPTAAHILVPSIGR